MVEVFIDTIANLGYILNIIVIPIAAILVGRKVLKEKKVLGKYNLIRLITFMIFLSFSVLVILEFIATYHPESLPWLAEIFGGFEGLNLYTFIIGFIATLGISLIAVANRWEVLYLTSLFFFGGMVILYLLTGYDAMIMPYIYISGILSVGFLYMTGFRVKDNGALGLAVFFTLAFVTVIIEEALITRLVVIVYDIFIIIFSLGFFKPFKEELVA